MITLDDIFDQPAAIDHLRRALAADRLPHALIFGGPVGVGKATTAFALAAVFLCPNRPAPDRPCGQCESCRASQAGSHPDYHVVTRELIRYHDKTGTSKGTTLSINVVRPEVIEKATRKPMLGHGQVFVIEEAERMQPAAQNALLKTLEEPPGRTLIVLLTDSPGQLLSTIRSRCQTVLFAPLPKQTVLRELTRRHIPADTAAAAAELAAGSLGEALRWIEDGVLEQSQGLLKLVDTAITGRGAGDLPDSFKSAGDAYAEAQLKRDELASKDQAMRSGLELYFRLAAERARSRMSRVNDEKELERCCTAVEALGQAEQNLGANVSIPLTLQQLAAALER